MTRILQIAKKYKIKVVEDGAKVLEQNTKENSLQLLG